MSAGRSEHAKSSLRSMTGYAAAVSQHNGFTLTVTLRSVNHRYFDLRTHFPEALLPLEREARTAIQARSPRGHLDLKVSVDAADTEEVVVDEALAAKFVDIFRRLGTKHGLSAETSAAAILQMPGVIARRGTSSALEISPGLHVAFQKALEDAVSRWDAMRAEEAALLVGDLRARVEGIGKGTSQIEQWLNDSLREAQQRLTERLQALAAPAGIEPARLAQEAILLADRTDPTEEIQRLKAHVKQFGSLLEGQPDAGRKLDFLLQEMQREANTLLTKVAGLGKAGLPIGDLGLEMKAELEKLREQVQNLQ